MCGDTLGYVAAYPFHFEVLNNSPIRQHSIVYPPEKRKWIDEYLRGWAELGTMCKVTRVDKDPVFVSSVVLVEDGQSGAGGKIYRLAPNLAEANTRVQFLAKPMEKCAVVLDKLQGSILLSVLDVKAAFNNIPLPDGLENYCGIVT